MDTETDPTIGDSNAAAVSIPAPPIRLVDFDAPCRQCKTNLRGQQYAADCPRCGTAVLRSVAPAALRNADRVWKQKLVAGLALLIWGPIMYVAWLLFRVFLGRDWPAARWADVVAKALPLVGAWLLTTPEPAPETDREGLSARRIARTSVMLLITMAIGQEALSRMQLTVEQRLSLLWIICGVLLFSIVGEFNKFLYLEQLADRIPDDKLVRRAQILKWIWASAFGLHTLIQFGLTAARASEMWTFPDNPLITIEQFARFGMFAAWIFTLFFFLSIRVAIEQSMRPATGDASE